MAELRVHDDLARDDEALELLLQATAAPKLVAVATTASTIRQDAFFSEDPMLFVQARDGATRGDRGERLSGNEKKMGVATRPAEQQQRHDELLAYLEGWHLTGHKEPSHLGAPCHPPGSIASASLALDML